MISSSFSIVCSVKNLKVTRQGQRKVLTFGRFLSERFELDFWQDVSPGHVLSDECSQRSQLSIKLKLLPVNLGCKCYNCSTGEY